MNFIFTFILNINSSILNINLSCFFNFVVGIYYPRHTKIANYIFWKKNQFKTLNLSIKILDLYTKKNYRLNYVNIIISKNIY